MINHSSLYRYHSYTCAFFLRRENSARFSSIFCILLSAFFMLFSAVSSSAQNCKKISPAGDGQDDSARINDCLQRKGFAKLKGGTFLLYAPIVFPRNTPDTPVSGVRLLGKGMEATKLIIQ